MREADEEANVLRRYLLGELSGEEQERVEERFITDRDFKERVLAAEDGLIEDYLDGWLSAADKEQFVGHFLSTPEQQRKVKIAASLERYLSAERTRHPQEPSGEILSAGSQGGAISGGPLLRNPWVFVPASLAVVLAVIFCSVWLAGVQQRRNRLTEIRREMEQLNSQPASAEMPSVFLTPLAPRGGGDSPTPQLTAGSVVQLWLLLIKDEYPSYQVILRKDGEAEQFPVGGLRAETTTRGKAVRVRIPSDLAGSGLYVMRLDGVEADGTAEEVGEYSFRASQ